jgi:hypothetical protein
MTETPATFSIRTAEDAAAFWSLPVAPVDLLLEALSMPRSSFYSAKAEIGIRTFKLGRRVYCHPQQVKEAINKFSAR